MMKRRTILQIGLVLMAFCFACSQARAQFIYLEGGLNYNVGLYNVHDLNSTGQHSFQFSISAEVRPIQNFGFGAELNIPVVQFGTFTYGNAETINGGTFYDFKIETGSDVRSRYVPDEYNYRIKSLTMPRFFARYYVVDGGDSDFFIEGRLAFGTMSEEFTFERDFQPEVPRSFSDPYPAIPAVQINHQEDRKFIAPGIQLGARKRLSDHLSMSIGGGVDVNIFDDGGFDYVVSHDYDVPENTTRFVRYESQAQGAELSFFFDFSIGYFF